MLYVDYIYYKDTYKGTKIPDETSFNNMVRKASGDVRILTGNKVSILAIPDVVKNATCRVAEIYQEKEILQSSTIISSETVGPRSKTYDNSVKKKTDEDFKKEIQKAITEELFFTGLLYRGI